MLRRAIAFVGHLPGLWLFYRETIPPPLRTPNAIAVGLTLAAMAVAYAVADGWAVLWTWIVGHFAWGTYLAAKLPEADVDSPAE